MLDARPRSRRPRQFGLWALMAGVTLMAMLMALVHYWIDGPYSFRLVVVCIGIAVYLILAVFALLVLVIVLAKK